MLGLTLEHWGQYLLDTAPSRGTLQIATSFHGLAAAARLLRVRRVYVLAPLVTFAVSVVIRADHCRRNFSQFEAPADRLGSVTCT